MSVSISRQSHRRVFFLLVDGLADVSDAQIDDLTTLQKANTPTLDLLAACGINGLLDPVEPGLACGSDTAHLSILGYDPRKYYRGRGAFESMGAGIDMIPGDIAFKCNFATMDMETKLVVSRRADRHFEVEGPILSDALNNLPLPSFPDCQVTVKYATEHRCGVRVRGPGLTDSVTGTDPLKDNKFLLTSEPLDDTPEARKTAQLINEMSKEFSAALQQHPINKERLEKGKAEANIVLLRGCGVRIDVPTFETMHGYRGFMIAPTAIIAGLGLCLGLDRIIVPGTTGDYHTNVDAKGAKAVEILCDQSSPYDFAFVHIKAVDDAGHDKNLPLKISFLEKIDKMMATVVDSLCSAEDLTNLEFSIVVTGDHSTPVMSGDHSCEPVPLLLCSVSRIREWRKSQDGKVRKLHPSDDVTAFSEVDAHAGFLGRFPGSEVMNIIKHFA
eukprot:TRINITY_DN7228_c0_g1_i1.p1 TRINITY_DN7228_c0_g1~~TRINITY_DN7228_c0_g1_i1.p1  ORF type:complete len:443 (-),score=62.61 TRINITY_DN7228_c0_g1_i1:1490-2818(-)